MALSVETKSRLATLDLAADVEVTRRLELWMAQSGRNDEDVARLIYKENGQNYSRQAVNLFRTGRYPDNGNPESTMAIRAELLRVIAEHPTVCERRLSGRTYETYAYREIRQAFFRALDKGTAYCLYGSPGTQKSRMLQALCTELQQLDAGKNGHGRRAVYVYCRAKMSRRDLLLEVALAAGIIVGRMQPIGVMLRKVRTHFVTRRVLLILDEAHHLDNDTLETVRELLDEPPYFGLLFAGSHDLQERFKRLEMEQWRERFRTIIQLRGLTPDEIREIYASEVGSIGDKALAKVVGYCYVPDYRLQRPAAVPCKNHTWTWDAEARHAVCSKCGGGGYLSARQLFFFLDELKQESEGE